MRMWILTAIAAAAWVRPSAAQRAPAPFPRYVPRLEAGLGQADGSARQPDAGFRPHIDPVVWIGGSIGAGAGLLGGYAVGGLLANRFHATCCGDDPGQPVAFLGALAGTMLGTALGGELGARLASRPPRPFGRRIVGGLAGALAGGMVVVLLGQTTDIEGEPALVVYSLTAGLAASSLEGPPPTR